MSEINFFDLKKKIKTLNNSGLFYIYGDLYLCDQAKKTIIEFLLSSQNNQFSVEEYDGNFKSIDEVCESVFTYSFFSDQKIIVYENPSFFEKAPEPKNSLEKIKKNYIQNRLDLSASGLIRMFSEDPGDDDSFYDELGDKIKNEFLKEETDNSWIDQIIAYAKENKVKISSKKQENDLFLEWLEKDFPENNYLIILSSKTDKRSRIYKKLDKKGEIINCLLPSGQRKADKDKRDAAAREIVLAELEKAGKNLTINNNTLNLLLDYSGDDLRTLVKNLNQVIVYSGNKNNINTEDLKKVLERTREDPIFAFTGAVSERKIEDSLFYMYSLISNGFHPLQILSALYNQFSNLLLASEFLNSHSPGYLPTMNFNVFLSAIAPQIENYENSFLKKIEDLSLKKSKDKKYLISNGKKISYPVFFLLKHASNFKIGELKKALIELGEIDNSIKNGAEPIKIIESFLFRYIR
ncbi:MAG: hypothetical protein RBR53_07525 [Desulforegulaceae bacterium]|nr:hypothetical protein [Desulforegulaceae bacterium]